MSDSVSGNLLHTHPVRLQPDIQNLKDDKEQAIKAKQEAEQKAGSAEKELKSLEDRREQLQPIMDSVSKEIKEYGKQLLEDKILLMGMKYEKKDYPRLYGTLYAIGVNSVIWIDGEEKIEIEIGKIANQRDMSKIEPSKRPLLNPSLELSGIYFMQELRRPVKQEEHKNIRELEEELIANLRKAEFLIAINAEQEEDGKLHIPYLKNKEDKIMQPVFTDVMEFEKFGRGKNLRVAKVTIDKLPSLMIPQANAYVVNPMGFNLVLNKEQIEKIAGISK